MDLFNLFGIPKILYFEKTRPLSVESFTGYIIPVWITIMLKLEVFQN